MTMEGQPSPLPKLPEILNHLSPDDALAVLRTLAQDEVLAARIRQVAAAHLETEAPHDEEDVKAIAEEVRWELEQLHVEEVWDRAGPTRNGYVDTADVADEMIQRVVEPYQEEIARYWRLGLDWEAAYLCMGLIKGLYLFEYKSESEFKDWAIDLPVAYAQIAVGEWNGGQPGPDLRAAMNRFVTEQVTYWKSSLADYLGERTTVRRG